MEFALMTEPQLGMDYDTILDLATWAEGKGLAAFSRSDHYSFMGFEGPHATDAFATLAGLARDTSSIELCVLVAPITFRHPAVLAKMAATIDEMSGGRLRLGVGTGWMEEEHSNYGIPFHEGERFDLLEEALGYLHHAFGRADGPFHGAHYSLTEPAVRPLPTGRLPIIVGGSGQHRTPRLAGTYAADFNMGIRDHNDMRTRIGRAQRAAEEAGRDPGDLQISVMTPAIVGRDESGFREVLGRMADADPFGRSAEDLESRYRDRGLPVGTGDEAAAVLSTLEDLGVSRIYMQHFGPYEHDLLEEIFGALGAL